jgi:hypothetical protein
MEFFLLQNQENRWRLLYYRMQPGRTFPTLRKNVKSPSSLFDAYSCGVFFGSQSERSIFLRNVGKSLPDYSSDRWEYQLWEEKKTDKHSVQSSVDTPAILTEVFLDLPQFLQANSEMPLRIGPDCFLRNCIPFIIHHHIVAYISDF